MRKVSRASEFVTFWAGISTIVASIAAVAGFAVFDKFYLIHRDEAQIEQKPVDVAPGASGLAPGGAKSNQSTSNHEESTTQACEELAKEAADDITQGFLLSAERAKKMRADLQCGRGGRP